MTTPTPAQLHHLAARARDGVALPAEHDALAAGITAMAARIVTLEHVAAGNKRHVQLIVPDLEKAEAAIERVRELHREDDCGACRVCETRSTPLTWPCDTIRALDQAQQPTT